MRRSGKDEVMGIIVDIISENLDVSRERIKPGASIVDDLGADSLDMANILGAIEDKFEIEIPEDETIDIDTVDQLVEYIMGRIKEK